MITTAPIHASLAVADLAKARAWYSEKLGWEPSLEPPGTLVYDVGDSNFTLFESEFPGTAKNTVMNWNVDDVHAEVTRLRERGVTFEDYDFGDYKTVDGVMTDPEGGKTAWFKDIDGNIVGLVSPGPGQGGDGPSNDLSAMIATSDLKRAKAWYGEKLGFEPVFEFPDVVAAYRSDGSSFNVYQSQFAGSARNTVAVWRLKGIRDEVARLRGNGVEFEEYDFGDEGKTVGGILSDEEGDVNAWFKDPDGNIFALVEERD